MSTIRQKQVNISFSNLTYLVNEGKSTKKKILNNVYGQFKSGELNAIMGPSGSGKSTLMNILTGFVTNGVTGNINFGDNIKNNKICCYILQDDYFFPWFTVEEVMLFATTLKISSKALNLEERHNVIDNILRSLHLTNAKKTKCGALSGGQKKRLSIALELIDNPPVIFLDEPTTGLDSSSSVDLVQLLRNLCENEGRTIICTIHQPSALIYLLFGHIYVLNKGNCVYQGCPQNTIPFLQSIGVECPPYHNPADILLEVTTGEYGDLENAMIKAAQENCWRQLTKESQFANHTIMYNGLTNGSNNNNKLIAEKDLNLIQIEHKIQNNHIFPPNELFRLWVIIGRCNVQFYRDWTATHLKLFLHICCAILIGLLYGDSGDNALKAISNTSLCLVTVIYLWYTTVMPCVLRFPLEIATIRKETFNKWYKVRTYYLATIFASTPMHIIYSMVFVSIIYFMTRQPLEFERFGKFVLVHILLTIAASALGVLIGTFFKPVNGTFLAAITTAFMLIFSGLLIFYSHMSVLMRAVSYMSPLRFAFESIILTIYNNRSNMICPEDEIYCHFKNPKIILDTLGVTDESSYGFNVILIFVQLMLFKLIAFFGLRRALKKID